jgi:putative membrane protein
MMYWNGYGMSGWGYLFMGVNTLIFVGLLVGLGVLVARVIQSNTSTMDRSPRRLLADRYARGEISDDEYHHRLDTLRQS